MNSITTEMYQSMVGTSDYKKFKHALNNGADPNCSGANGTALDVAVKTQDPRFVRALLDKGADPNIITNEFNRTSLWLACVNGLGNSKRCNEIIELLIKHGANLDEVVHGESIYNYIQYKRLGANRSTGIYDFLKEYMNFADIEKPYSVKYSLIAYMGNDSFKKEFNTPHHEVQLFFDSIEEANKHCLKEYSLHLFNMADCYERRLLKKDGNAYRIIREDQFCKDKKIYTKFFKYI